MCTKGCSKQASRAQTCDEKHSGGDEGSHSPAILLEDGAGQQHHDEGDSACARGEVSHEGGVLIGIGELCLDLALPGHLHQIDTDTVCHHLS